jgi:hypothetical protein
VQTERVSEGNLGGLRRPSLLVLKSGFFEKIFDTLLKVYGAPGISMIYMMGRECGVEEVSQIRAELNENTPMTKRGIVEKAFSRFSQSGWGRITVEVFDTLEGSVSVNVSFNPFSIKCGPNVSGGCFFLHGLLVGTASEALERDLFFNAPRCQKASDGSCLLSFTGSMR